MARLFWSQRTRQARLEAVKLALKALVSALALSATWVAARHF